MGPPDAGLRHRCLGRVVPARAGGAARPGPGSGVWLGRRLPMPEQSATSNYIGNTRQRYRCLHSSLALALPGPQWMAPIPQECGWSGQLRPAALGLCRGTTRPWGCGYPARNSPPRLRLAIGRAVPHRRRLPAASRIPVPGSRNRPFTQLRWTDDASLHLLAPGDVLLRCR